MGRVEGKVAIVTGAASRPGIGSETARRLAEEGATVWLTDIDGDGVEATAALLRGEGFAARGLAHDVASSADWDRVVAAVLEESGQVDILVNNAGVFFVRPLLETDPATWQRTIDINLAGTFLGMQRVVRAMREAGTGGAIVNLSSTAGLVGNAGCSAYSASKGGVRLLSKSVAMEVAREGIRVNSVHPGPIRTNMTAATRKIMPDESRTIAMIPLRRMGEPRDIANMVLFLASDEASFITGAEMVVDGGVTAQ